jgi:RNA polymerase sigma-70 factor (ECF subfamily)
VKTPQPFDSCSDEELLKHIQGGQHDALGALVRRFEGELFGYLCRYLGNREMAEDVFQNTFLQVFTKIDQYEPGRAVRPWLYTIATHQAIDALRRNGKHQAVSLNSESDAGPDGDTAPLSSLLESSGPMPLDQLQAEEKRQQVRASIERLPEFLKQVVLLTYYQGLKNSEVAEILKIPVGTVKSRLHTALARLHQEWANTLALKEA